MVSKFTIKQYSKINEVKEAWEYLECLNPKTMPFQYYNYNKAIQKTSIFYWIKEISFPSFFIIYKNGKPIVLFPLCKTFSIKNRCCEYHLYGNRQNGIFDLLYDPNISRSDFIEAVKLLKCNISAPYFVRMRESSIVYKCFPSLNLESADSGVSIKLPFEGYGFYFSSLSKNVRQNIRTAYNRLNTDGCKLELKVIRGKDVCKSLNQELLNVYLQRSQNRYSKKFNFTSKYQYKYIHHYSVTLNSLDNSRYYILFINGSVAAFMGCFINHAKNCLIVPRLAINDHFRRYSPGMILLNEAIKHSYDHTNIKEIYLSRGVDKYKLNMGGVIYSNYNFYLK